MFLICGEALFDFFADRARASEDTPHVHFEAVAGGSPYNVAVGLARLERRAALFTGLSNDFLGERLHNIMRREGVDTRFLIRMDNPTTLSMVAVSSCGMPQYSFYHKQGPDSALRVEHLEPLPTEVHAIHVGSYSLVVSPTAETLLELLEREGKDRLVTLDPNVRLTIEPDLTRWQKQVDAFARYADVIKVSDEDLSLLYNDADGGVMAERWLKGRTNLVMVTRGSKGVTIFTATTRFDVATIPVEVVDAVGAGDTFQAAVLCWLSEHQFASSKGIASMSRDDLVDMVTFANKAAGITCLRRGPDLPRRHEIPVTEEKTTSAAAV